MKKNNEGFTLVELSIVLVVIGLIIGGVLMGQDLIKSAETRALISQVQRYNVAVNSFIGKYNAIPGDFSEAQLYLSSTAGQGNGDGIIGDNTAVPTDLSATNNAELAYFFQHLSLANLIDGSFDGTTTHIILNTNFPATKSNRGGIIVYGDSLGVNYYHIGLENNPTGTQINTTNNLTPTTAMNIDQKIDDGNPLTGVVQAKGGSQLEQSPSSGTTGCITSASSPIYNVIDNSTGYACQLRIRFM